MSFVTNDPSRVIRSVAQVLPAVAAAAGLGGSNFVPTPDDNKDRRLTGVYATFQTKLARLHVRIAGKELVILDFGMFAAAFDFIPLDQVYGSTLQIEYALESVNPGGPAILANTDDVIFRYEVVPG